MALTHDVGSERYVHSDTPDDPLSPVLGNPRQSEGYVHVTFAAMLDALVRERGLSNLKLGAAIDCDQSHIHRLRTGTRNPSPATLAAICDALGLDGLERDRLVIGAGEWPWPTVPDDTTLMVMRRLMEVSER